MSNFNEKNDKIIFYHKVQEGQTLEDISKIYNVNTTTLKNENKVDEVLFGDLLFIPQKNENIYVVKPMDNIFSVAKKLNVSVESLKQKNNCKQLFIGQKIVF